VSAPIQINAEEADGGPVLTILAWFCALLLGLFVLLLVGALVYEAFHSSLLAWLRDAIRFAQFFANLLIVFFAFPAFLRTRDRAFFCISAAAVCFGYTGLFSILFGVGPPSTGPHHMSREEAHWYYVSRYAMNLVGFFLYGFGIISLARRAQRKT
jgi:hypothetical protein